MRKPQQGLNRRKFLTTGIGSLAVSGLARQAGAAELTGPEKANVKVVNDFCAAWSVKGRDAVASRIKTFVHSVARFEVLETFAKGPMVFNERIDHFTGGPLRSWRGVGVFFLKDGKIVEWYDYTISTDRA